MPRGKKKTEAPVVEEIKAEEISAKEETEKVRTSEIVEEKTDEVVKEESGKTEGKENSTVEIEESEIKASSVEAEEKKKKSPARRGRKKLAEKEEKKEPTKRGRKKVSIKQEEENKEVKEVTAAAEVAEVNEDQASNPEAVKMITGKGVVNAREVKESPEKKEPVKRGRKPKSAASDETNGNVTKSTVEKKKPGRKPKKDVEQVVETVKKSVRRIAKAADKAIDANEGKAKADVIPMFAIQASGKETSYSDIIERVKSIYNGEIESLEVYVNADEKRVYYVVNKTINIGMDLF